MSYGLPVVTTPHGAIGYDMVDKENVLIANTAEGFSEAINLYYQLDINARINFLNSEWQLYCGKYSLEAVKQLLQREIFSHL